ncbi:MAG: membrane protein [Anaerolineaceae bacterium]|nr:MAG: membrane protein [Anaerolineaceae bacterium]
MNQQNYTPNTGYPMLPTSTLAIVSLVSGILSFVMLPVIGAIVAIWTGYEARKETRSNPPKAGGDGLATAGIVLGWVHAGLIVVSLCCAILYFGFFATIFATSMQQ